MVAVLSLLSAVVLTVLAYTGLWIAGEFLEGVFRIYMGVVLSSMRGGG
jgi:hypothetical protein